MFGVSVGLVGWVLGVFPFGEFECVGARLRGWGVRGRGRVWPSDLVDLCPTGRGVFLRRRVGLGVGGRFRRGVGLHGEAFRVWRAGLEGGLEGLLGVVGEVRSVAGLWALSSGFRWLRVRDLLPLSVEPRLPGWAGFSGGRPDLLLGPFPVEFVSGGRGRVWERKRLVLAAYGLLLEYVWGVPVDVGFLVGLDDGFVEAVCLNDDLRGRVLYRVSVLEDALESDPGVPESPEACPPDCPFRSVCWGGSGGVSGVGEASSGGSGEEYRVEEGSGGGLGEGSGGG